MKKDKDIDGKGRFSSSKNNGSANVLPKDTTDKRMVWGITGAIVLLLAIGALLWFLVIAPAQRPNLKGTVTEEVVPQSSQSSQQSGNAPSGIVVLDEPDLFPRSYKDWEAANEELLEDPSLPLQRNASNSLFTTVTNLPKESEGFTSDPDQLTTPEGGINPMFTAITEESFFQQTARIIEIFLNPVFGGWTDLQYPEGSEILVSDLYGYPFTENWMNAHLTETAASALPVFADINGDDYGLSGEIRYDGPRWIGELTSGSLETQFDEESLQYIANVTTGVRFLSFNADDSEVLEKNGTLTMRLVTTSEGEVLVDEALLEVG